MRWDLIRFLTFCNRFLVGTTMPRDDAKNHTPMMAQYLRLKAD